MMKGPISGGFLIARTLLYARPPSVMPPVR
jgi:hypothetical protein